MCKEGEIGVLSRVRKDQIAEGDGITDDRLRNGEDREKRNNAYPLELRISCTIDLGSQSKKADNTSALVPRSAAIWIQVSPFRS